MAARPLRDAAKRWTDASPRKGGGQMVTYAELFAFAMLVIAIIRLVLDLMDRNK